MKLPTTESVTYSQQTTETYCRSKSLQNLYACLDYHCSLKSSWRMATFTLAPNPPIRRICTHRFSLFPQSSSKRNGSLYVGQRDWSKQLRLMLIDHEYNWEDYIRWSNVGDIYLQMSRQFFAPVNIQQTLYPLLRDAAIKGKNQVVWFLELGQKGLKRKEQCSRSWSCSMFSWQTSVLKFDIHSPSRPPFKSASIERVFHFKTGWILSFQVSPSSLILIAERVWKVVWMGCIREKRWRNCIW